MIRSACLTSYSLVIRPGRNLRLGWKNGTSNLPNKHLLYYWAKKQRGCGSEEAIITCRQMERNITLTAASQKKRIKICTGLNVIKEFWNRNICKKHNVIHLLFLYFLKTWIYKSFIVTVCCESLSYLTAIYKPQWGRVRPRRGWTYFRSCLASFTTYLWIIS